MFAFSTNNPTNMINPSGYRALRSDFDEPADHAECIAEPNYYDNPIRYFAITY